VVKNLASHPLARMLAAGLKVTVNSDDPAYFGGYVNDNYRQVAEAVQLTPADVVALARNSFDASFLPDAMKRAFDDEVSAVEREFGVATTA
jgi:adenosine deaminase